MIKIIRADNGYIIKDSDFDSVQVIAFDGDDDKSAIRHLLYTMLEMLGETGGKYDKERIHIVTLPGDNYDGPHTKAVKGSLEFLKYYFVSEKDETT